MIELKDLSKVYKTSEREIVALDGINLTIQDGEIFGIIGLSGAGKSTLVRCINLLERPTGGEVIIDGKSLTELPRRELLKLRQQIGMIFQGFNLLEQRNVIKNICFPLELAGVKKEDEAGFFVVPPPQVEWAGAGNKYFATLLTADKPFTLYQNRFLYWDIPFHSRKSCEFPACLLK